jgi:hypothetical protein
MPRCLARARGVVQMEFSRMIGQLNFSANERTRHTADFYAAESCGPIILLSAATNLRCRPEHRANAPVSHAVFETAAVYPAEGVPAEKTTSLNNTCTAIRSSGGRGFDSPKKQVHRDSGLSPGSGQVVDLGGKRIDACCAATSWSTCDTHTNCLSVRH